MGCLKLTYHQEPASTDLRIVHGEKTLTSKNTAEKACRYQLFGETMPGRSLQSSFEKRNGYQGQFAEKDEETGYDQFEARLWDGRIGRWMTVDPAGQFHSPYLGMGNNPVSGVDPDGRLVVYVSGFLMNSFTSDYYPYEGDMGFSYLDNSGYWDGFTAEYESIMDDNDRVFMKGGNSMSSNGDTRYAHGRRQGQILVDRIKNGRLSLSDGETIKIVGHSHGGAHAAGVAQALIDAGLGNRIESILYLAPHQPGQFDSPRGIPAMQISNLYDQVSSNLSAGNWYYSRISRMMTILSPSKLERIDGVSDFRFFRERVSDSPLGSMGHLVPFFTMQGNNLWKHVRRLRRFRNFSRFSHGDF